MQHLLGIQHIQAAANAFSNEAQYFKFYANKYETIPELSEGYAAQAMDIEITARNLRVMAMIEGQKFLFFNEEGGFNKENGGRVILRNLQLG